MKKIKRILAVLLAVTLILGTAGCGNTKESNNTSDSEKTSSESGELKTIRIGSPTADATALNENAGLALNFGYLEEELKKAGYKAEYTGFGQGGTAVNEALASNQLDFGFVGDIPPIVAQSNGLNIQVVASLNTASELGIVVGNKSGIKSVSDLKGKKIVAGFGTVTYVYLVNLLKKNNMSIDDVEVINDIANGATLVASGDADAVISSGIGIYMFQNAGIGEILTSSREDSSLSAQYFAYGNTSFIKENSEAVKAIIRALVRSKEKANSDPDAAYKALATEERPAAVLEQAYPRDIGFDIFDPYLTKTSRDKYEATSQILFDNKIITSKVKAENIFNTEYLDEVYKELGLDIPS
ncbi:MAG: ABC transporter substrate-binding protein [Eubacterium sp.]